MFNNILILCLGNICRSPMAEGLLKSMANARDKNVMVSSAGITALVNHPAHEIAIELMQQKNIDINAHRARQVNNEMLLAAELILVMDSEQQRTITSNFPSICGKVHKLGKWSGFEIPDPYRRPRRAFEQALLLIEQGLQDWIGKIWI